MEMINVRRLRTQHTKGSLMAIRSLGAEMCFTEAVASSGIDAAKTSSGIHTARRATHYVSKASKASKGAKMEQFCSIIL